MHNNRQKLFLEKANICRRPAVRHDYLCRKAGFFEAYAQAHASNSTKILANFILDTIHCEWLFLLVAQCKGQCVLIGHSRLQQKQGPVGY